MYNWVDGFGENAKLGVSVDIEQQLKDAKRLLGARELKEENVKQSVIEPILRTLGWNTGVLEQVYKEFPVGNGRVDYALMDRHQPQVFIEAKRVGMADAEKAQEQLFGYARENGIPILVLTDGLHWHFYNGTGAGVWQERCFRRLALGNMQTASDDGEFLTECLGRDAVVSGKAQFRAHQLLREHQALEYARRELPNALRKLLSEQDPQLCDLLGKKVHASCGVEPRADDIRLFLKNQVIRELEPMASVPVSEAQAKASKSPRDLTTPEPGFTGQMLRVLILQVLIEKGDRGGTRQVKERLAEILSSRLGGHDRETNSSGRVRWVHAVDSEVAKMRNLGLLQPVSVSGKGWWEISDQGRTYWSEHQ